MFRVKPHLSVSKLGIAAALALPAFIVLYVILHFGVNIPFEDEWEFSSLLQSFHTHHLTGAMLWEQHNEHRIFFPRLLMLMLANISHWNIRLETLVSLLLAAVSVTVLALIVRKSLARERLFAFTGVIAVSWIIFSPVQWENWLWGWQIEWFLMIAAAVSTIWLTLKAVRGPEVRYWWLGGAAVSAIIASYSLGGGIFIWAAILPILIGYKAGWRWVIGWSGLGVLATIVYLIGYHTPANDYPASLIIHQPFDFIRYFFTLIGRPLGNDIISSSMWGLGLSFIFVLSLGYLTRRGRAHILNALPWISLGIFALFVCGLTSFSRFGAGVEQAMSSRYYAVSSLYLVAVIITALIALAQYRHQFKIGLLGPLLGIGFFGMLIVNNYFYGIEPAGVQSKTLKAVQACALSATAENHQCLIQTYPYPDVAWKHIEYLKTIHSGGF
jgi:hypothetical protein